MAHLYDTFFMLAFFVCICVVFKLLLNRAGHKQTDIWNTFLEREHRANTTTKKEFPTWLLLTFTKDKIPYVSHPQCEQTYRQLMSFLDKPMADLSQYDNITLKETFGVNHFHKLIHYEDVFFSFCDALYAYALVLETYGYFAECIDLLDYLLENQWLIKKCTQLHHRVSLKLIETDVSKNEY